MYSPHKHSLFAFKGYLLLYLILLIFGSHKKSIQLCKPQLESDTVFDHIKKQKPSGDSHNNPKGSHFIPEGFHFFLDLLKHIFLRMFKH